jgi:hypothetical protein
MAEKSLASDLVAQAQALESERLPWESLWQDCARVVHPRRGTIGNRAGNATSLERGNYEDMHDGTAMRANLTLANGQASRITPMGARWFVLKPPVELANRPGAEAWYQKCSEILVTKLAVSNFYNRAHQHYLHRGAFGTAALEVTSGENGKGLHFRSYPIGTYAIAENHLDEVDVVFRSYTATARQIAQMFPENVPGVVAKCADDPARRHERFEILHAILPRTDRDPRKSGPKDKPVASIHLLRNEMIILGESGFDEMPVAVSRWSRSEYFAASPYGEPPAMIALPEAHQANHLAKIRDVLAETAAFPRVLYPSDLKGDIDFRARGLTCYDINSGNKPQEWLSQGRYDVNKDNLEDHRQAIRDAFFFDLFSSISQLERNVTATEVRAIVGESRELFHPIFAGLTREFLTPVLRRCFALLLRQGEFPPPPAEVLQRDELGAYIADPAVDYVSSMALALEQSHLSNFADILSVMSPLAQADPSMFDFIDSDAIGPAFFRLRGLPEAFIRAPEKVAEIRNARMQQAQMMQAQQASETVKNLGGIDAAKGLVEEFAP